MMMPLLWRPPPPSADPNNDADDGGSSGDDTTDGIDPFHLSRSDPAIVSPPIPPPCASGPASSNTPFSPSKTVTVTAACYARESNKPPQKWT